MSIYNELRQIIEVIKPKSFLEIGIDRGLNLEAVDCPYKVGIDPNPSISSNFKHKVYIGASDDIFLNSNFKKNEDGFDLIFVDGLHEFKQVVRDAKNSLNFLNSGGVIVCHDVYPFDFLDRYKGLTDKECPGPGLAWTGDVWKLIFYVRFCMLNLDFYTISKFPGYLCLMRNIVSREKSDEEFDLNFIDTFSLTNAMIHKNLMNIVSAEEFLANVR